MAMHFASDGFSFRRQALLKSRACLDFTNETSVTGLLISGTQPDGTARRVVFEIDGSLYRFVNGVLDIYDDRGELDDILAEGNTAEELMALTDIPAFVKKRVFPWIALDAPADANVMPRIKIAAKVNSFNDVYTKTELSPIYELAPNARIVRVRDYSSAHGNATVMLKCRLQNPLTGWGNWILPVEATGKLASAIQFQASYTLTTLDGTDYAKVDSVQTEFSSDADSCAADFCELVTSPQQFYLSLGTCYALVKHDALQDCDISAFVKFAPLPSHRDIFLGTATGNEQSFNLPDAFIDQSTLTLDIGGRCVQDYHYDTQRSTITFTGSVGDSVNVAYDCGSEEIWREMALELSGATISRFAYRLSGSPDSRLSAVKIRFTKKSGHVEETVGVGNGKVQTFSTEHRANNLTCSAPFRYDEITRILKTLAPVDSQIFAAYNWKGSFPKVEELIVGWQAFS